jgi:hypothetical protein
LIAGLNVAFNEAAQALARVARKIRLAHLAVVDDIEAAGDLLFHHFGNRFADALGEGCLIDGFSSHLSRVHRFQIRRLRQCAGVGGQNSVGAVFH